MRVLVVGAGQTGMQVIEQLKKNPQITVLTADPRPEPKAVRDGLVDRLDVTDAITPLTLDDVVQRTGAGLVLMTLSAEELGLGETPGVDMLADALLDELAAVAKVPVIDVARGTV
ncbi:MAG TPA: hypothetical protein VLT88_15050 [Desulfosarcina sp.]|nr:hypothetical protein [Desulfosarcina sp.]